MSEGLALDFSTSGLVYNGLHRLVMLRDGSLTYTTYPAVDRLGQSELASQKFMGADQIATYRNAIPELSQAVALLGQEQAANWPNVPA
ncbi:hypothetical protein H7Y63_00090 [Polaromonas sp.]|nr:hypothetical protein [Candidatus Saccharibacteria bacterium]